MAQAASDFSGRPLILTVPGLHGSGPGHWQTLWEQTRSDTARVDLGLWDSPRRNPWVTKLDQAIRTSQAPVILVAHSLGCLAVSWWAELAGQPWGWPVAGALLVAPPDVDRSAACGEIRGFAPSPRTLLPFPSILVASDDDPHASIQRSFDMARDWGSHFVDAGPQGHINAESDVGLWHEGQALLDRLIGAAEGPMAHGSGFAEVQALIARDPARAGA
ncbi:RBBP9/YdeN family alpha/beta hydrolase [Sphingomonas solaris]|uniref:Alpha/beta hydrolase n=1 Tax=Alterirhizorhabdus solaris TaxID=2529389 RepID=A0A558RC78_9SPHN|nr:alpha/beta hydrolase [Sphingomonas solaris]TVV76862.1 alpha/beta hydrolase [Sphingomonas solaris]